MGDAFIVVSCAYGMVRLKDSLAFAIGALGLDVVLILVVIMNALANVNHGSRKALIKLKEPHLDWKGKQCRVLSYSRVMSKSVRSLRDLRIRPCSSFHYDKGIVLTTLEIILQCSVSAILLH